MATVGIPAETKDRERRVALDPAAVRALGGHGLRVMVQSGAGRPAGFEDLDYERAGAQVVGEPDAVWAADLVVKVKEPQPEEYRHFRAGLKLFAYLHLAAEPQLVAALLETRVEAHAFETVTDGRGTLPLLAPMSEIAGRAAVGVAMDLLRESSGMMAGGAAGVAPARAVVIGMGVAGGVAARGLRGLDVDVTGVDVDADRLRLAMAAGTIVRTVASGPWVDEWIQGADIVIGAALVPGERAPVVVGKDLIRGMRQGAVIIDLAIDQGGCVETSRPTTLSKPTFDSHGVVHYCVTNVPGQFPNTASRALSSAVGPRTLRLAVDPDHPSLNGSLNVKDGGVVHPAVASTLHIHGATSF